MRIDLLKRRKSRKCLTDIMVEDILEMSDEEIIQEMIDRGKDPAAEAARIKAIIDKAVALAKSPTPPPPIKTKQGEV